MKKILLALTIAALPLSSFAKANVEWQNPEDFRDAALDSMKTDKGRQTVLNSLEKYIKEQADRLLPSDQTLNITVTDLDLAGEYEPWRAPDADNIRYVKAPYFAFVKFNYKLEDSEGRVLREGDETLRHFLDTRVTLANRDELAPYVRELFSDFIRSLARETKRESKKK